MTQLLKSLKWIGLKPPTASIPAISPNSTCTDRYFPISIDNKPLVSPTSCHPFPNISFVSHPHNSQPIPLILCKLAIVDIFIGNPFEPEPMFESLVQIFYLPAAQIDPALVVPQDANIPGEDLDAVGISFHRQILYRDAQGLEYLG